MTSTSPPTGIHFSGSAGNEALAGGGFIANELSSPAPSSTTTYSRLPIPRTRPLRHGSSKEMSVIDHVDRTLMRINRRHAKKFSSVYEMPSANGGDAHGYESFREAVRDIEGVVDVLWASGTPSLQVPYTISLSVLVNSYLPEYPFSPGSTFQILQKLDFVFASLLLGKDADSGALLPGFEEWNVVSMTEKIRIKSIVETCRVLVFEAIERVDGDEEGEDYEEDESKVENDDNDMEDEDEDFGTGVGVRTSEYDPPNIGRWEMEAARVYEKTIQLLGDELGKAGEVVDSQLGSGMVC